jgi:hypothetical protein
MWSHIDACVGGFPVYRVVTHIIARMVPRISSVVKFMLGCNGGEMVEEFLGIFTWQPDDEYTVHIIWVQIIGLSCL